jgi:hypothetical protein
MEGVLKGTRNIKQYRDFFGVELYQIAPENNHFLSENNEMEEQS